MKETSWENALKNLSHQLDLMQSRAYEDSARFKELREQIESAKIRFLLYQLDTRRKFLARSRGVASLAENKKGLPLTLGVATVASILIGIFTKDGDAALNMGVRGVNGALLGLGETKWVVCLGGNLEVAPLDNIGHGKGWVTWDSLKVALHELEEQAKIGVTLGSLDNIISELKKSKKLLVVIIESKGGATM